MSSVSPQTGYYNRLYYPFLLHVVILQAVIALARVATTYRAIELDLPVYWLGIITGSFAFLPVFLAVPLGRWLDRGLDAQIIWLGTTAILTGCCGLLGLAHSVLPILLATLLIGVGHLCIMAGHQTFAMRCGPPQLRDNIFGTYMVAIAVGQGMGPLFVWWVANGQAVAPSQPLFLLSVLASALALILCLLLPRAKPTQIRAQESQRVPLKSLLALHGFVPTMLASVMTVTSLDLLVVYLPLLGLDRNIDAGTIGILLALRSGASMVSRLFFAVLLTLLGRMPLMIICLMISAVAFCLLVVPGPVWLVGLSTILIGLGLGIAATLSLSSVVELAPKEARGTAVTLRITGNRVGQVTLPMLGGALAAALGAGGILATIGVAIGISGFAVWSSYLRRPKR